MKENIVTCVTRLCEEKLPLATDNSYEFPIANLVNCVINYLDDELNFNTLAK